MIRANLGRWAASFISTLGLAAFLVGVPTPARAQAIGQATIDACVRLNGDGDESRRLQLVTISEPCRS